jgi:ubiquinone/menaquinone biosynthesis C-methylase UbiE
MNDDDDIKAAVKAKYAEIAKAANSCCGPSCGCGTESGVAGTITMNDLYAGADSRIRNEADLGLGCGTPTAYADIAEGMTVLDLGSGAGIDVFLAAKQVGPTGRVIGVDMTEEMIARAETNRKKLGMTNVKFRKGEIENLPVESGSIDRILSNCVINLVPEKEQAFAEMYRVLKPGGKFTVSDIVSIGEIPSALRANLLEWAGCVAGALDRNEYLAVIQNAGFREVIVVAEKSYDLGDSSSFGLHSITVSAIK